MGNCEASARACYFGLVNRLTRAAACLQLFAALASAASVLSHEAVIDAVWDTSLRPLLAAAYPNASGEDIKKAHGYAYGGAIVQDLGYYPHGNKEFSDMAHYVRTGAFVLALIRDSQSLDDLAFALGALSHYASDPIIHADATNPGEALLYPKLRRRFGPILLYEQDPSAHVKTEFGFDVLEVAKGRFAPQAYHDFIGFYVADDLLARAFRDTYGLQMTSLFPNFDRAVGSFRRDVSVWIPRASRVAWASEQNDITASEPNMTRRRFVYVMRRAAYEHDWGKDYQPPSLVDRFLAVLLKLLPPVGPLRSLRLRLPTPQVETLFMASFEKSAHEYVTELAAERSHSLKLSDPNYDIGRVAKPGEYKLEDEAYAYWLNQLTKSNFADLSAGAGANILAYYADPDAPIATKRNPKTWSRVQTQLTQLKAKMGHRSDLASK